MQQTTTIKKGGRLYILSDNIPPKFYHSRRLVLTFFGIDYIMHNISSILRVSLVVAAAMAMTVRPLCFASPLARNGAQRPDRFSKKEWISSVRPARTLSIVKSSETLDTREVGSDL